MFKKQSRLKTVHYTSLIKQRMQRAMDMLLSERARPLRFVFTGGLCGLVQLLLFALLERSGWPPLIANSVAFLLSAQVNFLFSTSFTWGDRLVQQHKGLLRRWLAFHGSILGTALLNQLVFLLVRLLLPNEIAVVLGIGVAALANFVLLDRQVFRQKRSFVIDQQKRDTEQELKNKNSCRK